MKAIEIDEKLVEEVKRETGNKTDKGAIEKAVREYIRMEKIRKDIQSMKGKVSFQ